MIADSTVTCPGCGTAKTETMPTDACQYFYVVGRCEIKIKQPKKGCDQPFGLA